jgi:V/A-type H+-transporting ATPase subunit E
MQDIQSLLEKINREGVEKADAEAKRIISDAKTSAEAIVREAKLQAEKFKAEAEKSAADYSSRAEESIRQAARDVVLETKEAINTLLERLLIKDVNTALNDEKTVCELVESAIKELSCKEIDITSRNTLRGFYQSGYYYIVTDKGLLAFAQG